MNRKMKRQLRIHAAAMTLLAAALLAGCGGAGNSSAWDAEESVRASDRLLPDMVAANWSVAGEASPDGAKESLIRIELVKKDGTPVESFEITHEKLLHLIVVSKDLSYFNHIHPEYAGEGAFEIANAFPGGGEYRMIADFKPSGGDAMTKLAWVTVAGDPTPPGLDAEDVKRSESAGAPGSETVIAGSLRITLALPPEGLTAGEEAQLSFTLTDAAAGDPVSDLEPYLGAIGHVVALSADGERYVHIHAGKDQGTGPDAQFEAVFPKSGTYKLWAQFRRNGAVVTGSFAVQVN